MVEFYGFPDAYRHLYFSGLNQRDVDLLKRVATWGAPLIKNLQPDQENPVRLP